MSFLIDKVEFEGLTYDDVLLIPSYSEVLPREVDLTSKFTRSININTPIVTLQWIQLPNIKWPLPLPVKVESG
jgi:hypothetical protein